MNSSTDFTKEAVAIAQKAEASDVIALMTEGINHQIRFSNSNIDISKKWKHSLLETFLAFNRKVTEVDIQDPTPEKLKRSITRAAEFARSLPDNELFGGIENEKHTYPEIQGLFDKEINNFPEKAAELVNMAIQSSLDAGAKRAAGVLYFGNEETSLVTSNGLEGNYRSSYYRFTIRSFVNYESSGQDIAAGKSLKDIEKKLTEAGARSGKIANMAKNGKQGKAGKYDLIMSPTVAANVLGQVTNAASPLMIFFGMSPLGDKMGKQIGPENLTISDNPTISEGLASRPFDVEGTPSSPTPIIKDGVLAGLVHNTSTSKIMQAENTGNSAFVNLGVGSKILAPAPTNMVYEPGDYSRDEIIAESKKPTIYITSNWYTRYTNMLESEFSTIPRDGMFLIEDGEIKKPIRKLRLADNLLGICKRIEAIGKDIVEINWWEVGTPTFIPTIKASECNFTAATK